MELGGGEGSRLFLLVFSPARQRVCGACPRPPRAHASLAAFGKPASWISVIVFAVCWIWCIIGLAVSASYGWLSSGGYGLGVTGGVLGFLVTPVMVLWLMWTNLNEWDPAWIIFLIVLW